MAVDLEIMNGVWEKVFSDCIYLENRNQGKGLNC